MSKQLMIYERAVPLRSEAHSGWSVKTGASWDFARNTNSVPVVAAEFAACAPEYAIVFAGEGDVVFPSVILGMRANENACVAEDGSWRGTYVPAFLRRYPFVFASSEDGQTLTLCIDEEFEGFNEEGRGERLFDTESNRTKYLEDVVAFASEYQTQLRRTDAFCKRLVQLDLLEQAHAQFTLPGGERTQMQGFKTINRDKLRALPGDVLAEMARTDELELCFVHLQSLNSLKRMAQRLAGDTPETVA